MKCKYVLIIVVVFIIYNSCVFSKLNQSEFISFEESRSNLYHIRFYNIGNCNSVIVSPDGKYVYATLDASNGLEKLKIERSKVDLFYEGKQHNTSTGILTMDLNGKYIYTVDGTDYNIFKRDISTGDINLLGNVLPYPGGISEKISPDGKYIYFNEGNISRYEINLNNGYLNYFPGNESFANFTDLDFSPDGEYVYITTDATQIDICKRKISDGTLNLIGNHSPVPAANKIRISPDGNYLYTLRATGGIYQYTRNLNNGTLSNDKFIAGTLGNHLEISPDGKNIYVVDNNNLYVYYINNNNEVLFEKSLLNVLNSPSRIAISPDSKFIFISCNGAAPYDGIAMFYRN